MDEASKRRLRRYGLEPERFDEMFAEQDGLCAICLSEFASAPHVDHDHDTGRVRELLCGSCNRGIGLLGDDSVRLRSAAEYIDRHRTAEAG